MNDEDETSAPHPGETLRQPIPADPIPVRDPDAPQVAERKTHVEWATARGMVPKILEQPRVQNQGAKLVHGRINPKWDEYAQARAHHGWLPNQEMTEAEFEAALEAPKAHVFR